MVNESCEYLKSCPKGDFKKCCDLHYMQNCSELGKILQERGSEERRKSLESLDCGEMHAIDIIRLNGGLKR